MKHPISPEDWSGYGHFQRYYRQLCDAGITSYVEVAEEGYKMAR